MKIGSPERLPIRGLKLRRKVGEGVLLGDTGLLRFGGFSESGDEVLITTFALNRAADLLIPSGDYRLKQRCMYSVEELPLKFGLISDGPDAIYTFFKAPRSVVIARDELVTLKYANPS
jgi:hypothetical protein